MGINLFSKKEKPLTKVVNTFATIPLLEFKVVRFKDKTHKTPKFRYWIAFRIEDSTYCVLNTITSQIDYIARFYRNDDNGANSIVVIKDNEYNPPLDKLSYIDCNIKSSNYKTYKELADNIIDWEKGLESIPVNIPENIVNRIVDAILNSNHTSEDLKKLLRKKYQK